MADVVAEFDEEVEDEEAFEEVVDEEEDEAVEEDEELEVEEVEEEEEEEEFCLDVAVGVLVGDDVETAVCEGAIEDCATMAAAVEPVVAVLGDVDDVDVDDDVDDSSRWVFFCCNVIVLIVCCFCCCCWPIEGFLD